MDPDILCLQETKAQDDQVAEVLASNESLPGLFQFGRKERLLGNGHSVQRLNQLSFIEIWALRT